MRKFNPEGTLINTPENRSYLRSQRGLEDAMAKGRILEAYTLLCDSNHNLIVDLGCMKGIIPRIEGAAGIESGATKDIALITKVSKPVSFIVTGFTQDEQGNLMAVLSRRKVQEDCISEYISCLVPGDVIPARVTHLEQFGAFVDIGCGVPSLIPIDAISVSRISHPADRFKVGQEIRVVVKAVKDGRVWLSHKELLGSWEENAAMFSAGQTVSGIVRSAESYGVFIELAPNLAGLAEPKDNLFPGQNATVYIKALIPEKMKVKLIIVDLPEERTELKPIRYFNDASHIDRWVYSSEASGKLIQTIF
ncbi:MAG: S1 RNA-binding domain-containing protein [Ruminococcus sp.]|nr:S1 RNA-binding domain-containing protein [Ruminococcus sp.]